MTGFVFLIIATLLVVPFWRILPRYGIHPYWSLLAALPVVAVIMLWIIAFRKEKS